RFRLRLVDLRVFVGPAVSDPRRDLLAQVVELRVVGNAAGISIAEGERRERRRQDAIGVLVALRAGDRLPGLADGPQLFEDPIAGLAVVLIQGHRSAASCFLGLWAYVTSSRCPRTNAAPAPPGLRRTGAMPAAGQSGIRPPRPVRIQ